MYFNSENKVQRSKNKIKHLIRMFWAGLCIKYPDENIHESEKMFHWLFSQLLFVACESQNGLFPGIYWPKVSRKSYDF